MTVAAESLAGSNLKQSFMNLNKQKFSYVECADLKVRYLKIGQGEPLLLLHTLRTQLDYFSKIIPELAKHYTVYALDLPGHGYSDIRNQNHDKPFFVHHVTEFIKVLALENVHLVGESIGASIALGIASQDKVSIKRVVALNPADYVNSNGLDKSSILGTILFTAIRLPFLGWLIANAENNFILKKVLEGGFNNNSNLPVELVNEFNRIGKRRGYSKAFRSIFLNWQTWVEAQLKYLSIKAPVTLVYSDNDWSSPQERQDMQIIIKGSRLVSIKDCGHFSSLEKPEKVIAAILQSED